MQRTSNVDYIFYFTVIFSLSKFSCDHFVCLSGEIVCGGGFEEEIGSKGEAPTGRKTDKKELINFFLCTLFLVVFTIFISFISCD